MADARVRMATLDDAAAIAAVYAPYCEGSTISFEYAAPSPAAMAERIRKVTAQFPWLVFEEDGVVGGYAYAGPHRERDAYRWSTDVSVYLAKSHQGRGVGRALYGALFGLLVRQGYFKAFAGIALPNPASVRLHEAMGFEPVGIYRGVGHKHGAWRDVAWYQKPLQPERDDPPPPRPIANVGPLP